MKKITYLVFLAVIVLMTSSCGLLSGLFAPQTNARVRSWTHVRPVLSALDDYYQGEKEYPISLNEICPKYRKKLPKLAEDKIWHMRYKRIQPDFYQLDLFHVHYDASYTNGVLKGADSTPFQ